MRALSMRQLVVFSLFCICSGFAIAECLSMSDISSSNRLIVDCHECEYPEDMVAAFESALPNGENYQSIGGDLYLAIRFTTFGINSMAIIPISTSCGQDWEETIQDNWSQIQEQLADLLASNSGGGGDAPIPLPVGGFGDDPMGCLINETTTVMQTITACDSNGQNCITWTVPLRTTRTVMAPGC